MKVTRLTEEQAQSLWDVVELLNDCNNVVVSICDHESRSMTDEFTREEFFEALTSPEITGEG